MEKQTYIKRRIGIQPGTCATDEHARRIDSDCRGASKIAFGLLKERYPDLRLVNKLLKSQIPGNKGACQPDGGLWFIKDKLVAVFEAKKQGAGGNAIERWYKNNYICRLISPEVSYVTFAIGPGARLNGIIHCCLSIAHLGGVNTLNFNTNSLFLDEEGFTCNEIVAIMVQVLEEASK